MRDQSRLFAERVLREATRTPSDLLYSGDHLRDVAEYVNQPLRYPAGNVAYVPTPPAKPFIHLYNLSNGPGHVRQFSSVKTFEEECEAKSGEQWHKAGIMFLTGNVTPEWLNTVGGEFEIDPRHLLEHLSSRPTVRPTTFTFPTLPSASTSILKLTIPTIGLVEPQRARLPSPQMQDLRERCSLRVREQARLRETKTAAGEPVLRQFHLHDLNSFSFEQEVTVSLVENGNRWTVLVMCDNSGDGTAPELPLRDLPEFSRSRLNLIPVIQLNRRRHVGEGQPSNGTNNTTHSDTSQTLALLASSYGRMLDSGLASHDPFYALYELLDFFAFAEVEFVNMMERHVKEQVDVAGQDRKDAPSLADFQYTSELLETHQARLKRLLATISKRDAHSWPHHGDRETEAAVDEFMTRLITDFEDIISRLEWLLRQSERGKDIVMGNTNALIAQRSLEHNIDLGRITTLGTMVATLYVPWSFLTGVFGMNFVEFGQGHLSILVWVESSAVVLVVSFLCFAEWRWRWVTGLLNRK